MSVNKVRLAIILLIVVIGGLATGGLLCVYTQAKEFDQIFMDEIYIEELAIGGLTWEEAKAKVSSKLAQDDQGKNITLYSEENQWKIPTSKFGKEYNLDQVLDQAFQIGHEGNMFQRFRAFTSKEKTPVKLELSHSYNKEAAQDIIKEYAQEVYIAPQDASMVRENRQFVITPEQSGQELDIQATAQEINKLYETKEEGQVEAIIVPIAPSRSVEFFEKVKSPLASFYTNFNNADPGRNVNLKVGARMINTLVDAGQTFALSDYLEPITSKNGYETSKVIVNGKLVDGIGGGICQVASTLYNSVLLTNLEIVSRQNHSMPVGYIPLGRDATYASNIIDFKFKNPTEYPVYIESYCENNRLYVNIFGNQSLKPENEIKFETVVDEVIPAPETKYEDDPDLPKGTEVQELRALDGKKIKLYRCTYQNGKLIDRKLENNSYYRPRAALIRVGTKEVPDEPAQPQAPQAPQAPEEGSQEQAQEIDLVDDPSLMDLYEEQM